jgi:hypothetical protein
MKYFKFVLVNKIKTEDRYISIEVTEIEKSLNTAINLRKLYPPTPWVQILEIPRKAIKKGLIVDTVL